MTDAEKSELKRLRNERKELLKRLDWFEAEGHSTVGIAFLRRHFAKEVKK